MFPSGQYFWTDSGIKLILWIQHSASLGSLLTSKLVDNRVSFATYRETGKLFTKESVPWKIYLNVNLWKKEVDKFPHVSANSTKTSRFVPYILHKNRSVDFSLSPRLIAFEKRVSHDDLKLLEFKMALPVLQGGKDLVHKFFVPHNVFYA